jgi:hypothetical protein
MIVTRFSEVSWDDHCIRINESSRVIFNSILSYISLKRLGMKSFLTSVVFVFVHLIVFSQESYQPMIAWSRWSVGIRASVDQSYRFLKETEYVEHDDLLRSKDLINLRNEREKPSFRYTAVIITEYLISRRFALEFGLIYAERGYETEKQNMTDGFGTSVGIFSSRLFYHFIDIPVRINVISKLSNRWFLSSGVGVTANFLIKRGIKSDLEYVNGTIEDDVYTYEGDYKEYNLSPVASSCAGYKLNDRSSIKAGPVFRYAILAPTKTPITEYLYQLGFQCSYSLSI